ncbi:MAG: class I SAM-dependent methyltransferase [Candidatus Margulisiibacteriota bacterium]
MFGYDLDDNLRRQAEYYENLLAKRGVRPEGLDWNNKTSQEQRFKVLRDIFSYAPPCGLLGGLEILDVGCGFGDFWGYLKKEKIAKTRRIKYHGVDISEKLLAVARKNHPDAHFGLKNILKEDFGHHFDFVFCCGAFNIRFMEEEAHLEYVKDLLLKMFQLSKIGVAANFLSSSGVYYLSDKDLNKNQYYYFRADEIVAYCRSLTDKFVLRHDYHPSDFTVYMFREGKK